MQCRILFLIILVGLCGVYGQDEAAETEAFNNEQFKEASEEGNIFYENGNDENYNRVINIGERYNEDEDIFEEYRSNGLEHNYYLPCEHSDNITCVRDYFVGRGLCMSTSHEDGRPIYRERHVLYMPNTNLTVVTTKSEIKFYGSRIDEFYINKRTNNLVLVVDFEGISIHSELAYFVIERRAKEPMISEDYLTANFTTTLTAIIPAKSGLSMSEARVSAYNSDAYPPFEIGPKISNSSNPLIAEKYEHMMDNFPTAVEEMFLTESRNYFFLYLQWYICNFGVPTSV